MSRDFKVYSFIFITAITGTLGILSFPILAVTYLFPEMLPFSLTWGEFASLYIGATFLGCLGLWLNARWLGSGKEFLPGDFEIRE